MRATPLAVGLWLPFAAIATPLASILAVDAETAEGRIAGLSALCAVALVPLALRRARIAFAAAAFLFVAGIAFLAVRSPDGVAPANSGLRSRFPARAKFRRYAVANLVPEIDQMKLGTRVMPWLDPLMTREQAAALRRHVLKIYGAADRDPAMRALGSVMADAYADRRTGHRFEYVPPHADGEKLPALLFLHGSLGNFKAYLQLLRVEAESRRFVLVCPSFGWGNWNEAGGVEAIELARADSLATLPIDPARVVLAGLSNGGRGVTRALEASPHAWSKVIFVSAVMETPVILDAPADGWSGREVLVLQGSADDRTPKRVADRAVEALIERGARADYRVFEGQDHFLFFAERERVLSAIGETVTSP